MPNESRGVSLVDRIRAIQRPGFHIFPLCLCISLVLRHFSFFLLTANVLLRPLEFCSSKGIFLSAGSDWSSDDTAVVQEEVQSPKELK